MESEDMSQESDVDDFNDGFILPTLIRQLKTILQQYPDDGQILKELIQNAEDAGARKITFLLDVTSYPARENKLHHRGLAAYQGPALYVYNDAVFTDEDWKGIRMLNESVKEKDPMKVGRFGLGFKSIYHLTDLPTIFSGIGIGFVDPHNRFFRHPTHRWNLTKDKDKIMSLEDQFAPFRQEFFGVTDQTFLGGYYDGTIFRFPLRTEGMVSELCDAPYSVKKVRHLFKSLEADSHMLLLFLRNLERIEVYERNAETRQPTKLMSIAISDAALETVREKRKRFISEVETRRTASIGTSVSISYPFYVEVEKDEKLSLRRETSRWIVTQHYGDAAELESAEGIRESLGLLPWVGVALPLEENSEKPSYLSEPRGHLFCFLPLPLEEQSPTGLRVHVNGYFAIDSNRRHLKWPTADQNMDELTDESLLWNDFLVNELVVEALVNLALYVADQDNHLKPELIFNIIPEEDRVTPHWKRLASAFFGKLPDLDIFHSPVSPGERRVSAKTGVFVDIEDNGSCALLIKRILERDSVSFVPAPLSLKSHFTSSVTPALVCKSLRKDALSLTEPERFLLVEYFLDNLEDYAELKGTSLLPLADGTWVEFEHPRHQYMVYVESSEHRMSLLPGLGRKFLRSDIAMAKKFQKVADQKVTQLDRHHPGSFALLLPLIFPSNWKNKDEVNCCEAPHLTDEWLEEFWLYVSRNSSYFSSNLDGLHHIYIHPKDTGKFLRLNAASPLIVSESDYFGTRLSSDMKTILKKIGLRVIDELPPFVHNCPSILGNYVLQPDAVNVLAAIGKLVLSKYPLSVTYFEKKLPQIKKLIDSKFLSLTEIEKKELQIFMLSGLVGQPGVVQMNRHLLATMPIFQTLDGSGFKKSKFVALNAMKLGGASDVQIPVNLPDVFLDLKEDLPRDLALKLGVKLWSVVEILERLVFPAVNINRYGRQDVVTLMQFVCDHFYQFQQTSSTFASSSTNVMFIEKKQGGEMVRAQDVFDHSDQTLRSLFAGENVFPVGEFSDLRYIDFLRKLRIKGQDSVTAYDVLRIAEKLHTSKSPDHACAEALLVFLDSHLHLLKSIVAVKLSKMSLSKALQQMRWLIPTSSRPANYPAVLEFVGDTNPTALVTPTDVYSEQHGLVVGSVKAVVNIENMPNVAGCFGLSKQPQLENIVQHLENVISCYTLDEQLQFQFTLQAIYQSMNSHCFGISPYSSAVKDLSIIPCIYIETASAFMKPSRCALSTPVASESLLPYLGQIPKWIGCYERLLKALGVRDEFQIEDYVGVLRELHVVYAGKKLSDTDMKVVLCIINTCLEEEMEKKGESAIASINPENVFIPNENGILCSADSLCYTNCPWIMEGQRESIEKESHFCNVHISYPIASKLGVKSVREEVLEKHSCEMSFGQHESLVNRLKRILTGYPFDKEVMNEMLQNADDAGATKIHFINDTRQLPAERVFEDKWKPLQGPSLCVFNNKPFTKDDLAGIQRLGEGSKSEDPTKTGQYGVGFNCVYHLTDAPTFLTQLVDDDERILCAFDPTLKFVPRATKESPGRLMKELDELKEKFPDVFLGYFDEQYGDCGGTMFRLPLRTEESKISKNIVTSADVGELFHKFKPDMCESLLFLNSVEEIQLKQVDNNGCLKTIYTVRVELSPDVRQKREEFREKVHRLARALQKKEVTLKDVGCTEISYEMVTRDDQDQVDTWQVIQRFGFEDSTCISENLQRLYASGDIGLLPRTGLAYLKNSTRKNPHQSRLFCFLPLPVTIDLPVHVNGHFALDSETRRNLWNDEYGGYKAEWNKSLLNNIVAPSFCSLILERRNALMSNGISTADDFAKYCSIFPNIDDGGNGQYIKELSLSLYGFIGAKNVAVIPVKWKPAFLDHETKKCLWMGPHGMDDKSWEIWADIGWEGPVGVTGVAGFFDDLEDWQIWEREALGFTSRTTQKENTKKNHEVVRDVLLECGFLLFDSPMNMFYNFKKAEVAVKSVTPEAVLEFFASYSRKNTLCTLEVLPKPVDQTRFHNRKALELLLKYCTGCEGYKGNLLGLPLLVTADGILRCFDSDAIKYEPSFCEIVPHIPDQFFDETVFTVLKLDLEKDGRLCKVFSVQDFAEALPGLLPPSQFKGSEKRVTIEELKKLLKDRKRKYELSTLDNFAEAVPDILPLSGSLQFEVCDKTSTSEELQRSSEDDRLEWLNEVWKFLHFSLKKIKGPTIEETEELHKGLIIPLMDWCLLPATFHCQDVLYPVEKSRCVILLNVNEFSRTFMSVLEKLGVPQPLTTYFPGIFSSSGSRELYYKLLGDSENAAFVVLALDEIVNTGICETQLTATECMELLHYLCKHFYQWKEVPNSMTTIQKLPVFTTVHEKHVSISNSRVYVIPTDILANDMEAWTTKTEIIFLKSESVIEKLLEYLGCTVLSVTEVYCSYIFPQFEWLSQDGRLAHLVYVRDKLLPKLKKEPKPETDEHRREREEKRNVFIESLHRLAFIPKPDGSLGCASEFYDDQNKVFHVMLDKSDFPPKPFISSETSEERYKWRSFLQTCGMIYSVTQDMFIKYAKQIEQTASLNIDEKLQGMSETLLEHLFDSEHICVGNFLQKIKNIRFINPCLINKDRKKLHKQFGNRNEAGHLMFIPFNGSVAKSPDLVWTAQSLIPAHLIHFHHIVGVDNKDKKKQVYLQLGMDEHPKPEIVLRHTAQVCNKWAAEMHNLMPPAADVLARVLKDVYVYWQANWKDISHNVQESLKKIPFAFDIKKCLLVRPDQLVFHMHPEYEIDTYLISFPLELGEFTSIFKDLGSTDDPTLDQYAMVLETVRKKADDLILEPNEKETACKALSGFFWKLDNEKSQVKLSRQLFLPGNDNKMRRSSDIVVNNCSLIMERMGGFDRPVLIDLNKCDGVSFSEKQIEALIRKLPAVDQPELLSSVVTDEMEGNFAEEKSDLVTRVERKLRSDELKEGLLRLVRHGLSTEEDVKETSILKRLEGLHNIQVFGVDRIETFLTHKGRRIENSEKSSLFHDRETIVNGEKTWFVYINGREITSTEDMEEVFYSRLVEIIQEMMGDLLMQNNSLPLLSTLKCGDGRVETVLGMHKISGTRHIEQRPFRPKLGMSVQPELHHLLKQEILFLRKGDFVALAENDPLDRVGLTEDLENNDLPTYILVRIVEAVDEGQCPSNIRYRIDDGKGEMKVDATVLYAFHRDVTDAFNFDQMMESDLPDVHDVEMNLDGVKREIKGNLTDAWKLPEETRRKMIKRMLLKWHPDKNPDDRKEIAVAATQYMLQLISRLEGGMSLDDDVIYSSADVSDTSSSYSGAYYDFISREAQRHRAAQENYRKNYEANASDVEKRRRTAFLDSFSLDRKPLPGEGGRWLRQAEYDLLAAANDVRGGQYPSAEWACYKYYQGAIKSLKGVHYIRNANNPIVESFDVLELANDLKDTDIINWSSELQQLLTSSAYMQYPNEHKSNKIPHDAFTKGTIETARLLSENIFKWCQKYIKIS